MNKRNLLFGLLLPLCLSAYSQVALVESGGDGPQFSLSGTQAGMFSIGFMADGQMAGRSSFEDTGPAPGVYYGEDQGRKGRVGPGKNGYYTETDFRMLFSPMAGIDLFVKFLAQYRPGSPYIPLQLEENSAKTYSNFSIDSAYGRIDAINIMGLHVIPINIWLKAGKFDTLPSQFNRVARHGSERYAVLGSLRTANEYALQLEAMLPLPWIRMVSLSVTTHAQFNDGIAVLLDDDDMVGGTEVWHGDLKPAAEIPLHAALKLEEISLPFGALSAELIYAYNAMHIYSGNNFGLGVGLHIPVGGSLSVPIGIAAALYGKNIDPVGAAAIYTESGYSSLYEKNGYHYNSTLSKSWDSTTTSFRQALRIGIDAGAKYTLADSISAELNLSFILSQIAHYYRDTLTLPSLTADVRASWQNRFFLGGGIFLGTLAGAEWKTGKDTDPSIDDFSHIFNPAENMGFEIYGGLQYHKSRFVLGYNMNRGLSMNNYIESISAAQIKYRQKDSLFEAGHFERSGFFTKLVISW